jgi:hypothetical protein
MNELETISLHCNPEFFVVRLPWPYMGFTGSHTMYPKDATFERMKRRLEKPNISFKVVRQPVEPDQDVTRLADQWLIDDMAWRVGTIFSPSSDAEDGFAMTEYYFFTPVAKIGSLRLFFSRRNFRSEDTRLLWF